MLAWLAAASVAQAGSCCVGSTWATFTRPGPCERFMAGTSIQGEGGLLRWDDPGAVTPSSVAEAGVEATVALGVGLSRRMQVAATLPMRHTWRSTSELAGAGGGVGDGRVVARYNLVLESAAERHPRPGLWLTAGARLPTGQTSAATPSFTDRTWVSGRIEVVPIGETKGLESLVDPCMGVP